MSKYLEIYDNTKTYLFPNMTQAIPEQVAETYTVVGTDLPCVIETDASKIMFYTAPVPLQVMRGQYNIDHSLSDEEALEMIESILNAPTPEPGPTAQDRIAAAMEYQNLISM